MNLGKPTCVSSNQKRGFVVKVDGIDGSGKTEAVRGLVERLSQKMTVAQTAEFRSDQDLQTDGGRSVSRLLYDLSLDPVLAFDVTERQFAMAISSHRSNRVVLSKLISTADVVICDRSTPVSYTHLQHRLGLRAARWRLPAHCLGMVRGFCCCRAGDVVRAGRRTS